jgi:hypothetical protein
MDLFTLLNIPKTGDPFNPTIFIVILAVCLGLIVLVLTRRATKPNEYSESLPEEPSETIEEDNE